MGWTTNDVIAQVRSLVQDTRETSYRHSDDKLISYLNSAFTDAKRLRPDIFLGDGVASLLDPPPQLLTDQINQEFPIDALYITPFIDYVAGMVGMEDDEYAVDGRAVGLQKRFAMKLAGKGM